MLKKLTSLHAYHTGPVIRGIKTFLGYKRVIRWTPRLRPGCPPSFHTRTPVDVGFAHTSLFGCDINHTAGGIRTINCCSGRSFYDFNRSNIIGVDGIKRRGILSVDIEITLTTCLDTYTINIEYRLDGSLHGTGTPDPDIGSRSGST